mgnify:CR=1 FL=1
MAVRVLQDGIWPREALASQPGVPGGEVVDRGLLAVGARVEDLNRAKPTLFISVPRLWLKFQLGVFKKLPKN